MTRFTPFPLVNSRYGAPMGRRGGQLGPDATFENVCVSHPQGEYDSGGAYWGLGGKDGPVYAVWQRGKGREGVVYVRARSGRQAKLGALAI